MKRVTHDGQQRLAGEPGFEPRLTESESGVLPLHYSPVSVRLALANRSQTLNSNEFPAEAKAREKPRGAGFQPAKAAKLAGPSDFFWSPVLWSSR